MKFKKSIVSLALMMGVSLFAADLNSVSEIVDEINATKDTKEKAVLMDKLKHELSTIDKKELPKTQKIVSKIFIAD